MGLQMPFRVKQMQPISVNVAVQAMHVPALICSNYSGQDPSVSYSSVVAAAVAQALGIEDFLFKPERIHELRRLLWEKNNVGQETLFTPVTGVTAPGS